MYGLLQKKAQSVKLKAAAFGRAQSSKLKGTAENRIFTTRFARGTKKSSAKLKAESSKEKQEKRE